MSDSLPPLTLDDDLRTGATFHEIITGSAEFAHELAKHAQRYRDQRHINPIGIRREILRGVVASAFNNGVEPDLVRNCGLGSLFGTEEEAIETIWAEEVRRHATANRKAEFLAEALPKLNHYEWLAERIFEAVWAAEQSPVDAVQHNTAHKLAEVFACMAEELTADADHAAALAVLDDSYLGACLVPHGGVALAWRDYRQKKALDRMAARGYARSALEGRSGDAGTMLAGAASAPHAAIWGSGNAVLWASGEALLICAGVGVGKTTLAGLLVRALLLGGEVLGQPVRQLDHGERVLYLALDRPEQVKRSMLRQFTAAQRAQLGDRLVIWEGELPADAAENPNVLRDLADYHDADVVLVDSLKDAALGLTEDRAGAGYNTARKRLLESGRELVELHHLTKGGQDYGSVWLTAGAGSVLKLTGKAGGQTSTLKHEKAPAHQVGPLRLVHDRDGGEMELRRAGQLGDEPTGDAATGKLSLLDWAKAHGSEGVTAVAAAMFLTGSADRAEVEKARRALDRHAGNGGELVRVAGERGRGGKPSRWVSVEALEV
ncbi:AAA family ATPase [Mycobacterium sp.]|uniref:AAA family ATPase n=1 Tax=Mycobacterium sp. TaxID=1785 RepID=UPI003F962266